jgi:tRNA (guanine37-N1)-methyltransferase
MRFDILTIFPEIFDSYFNTSILKRAQEKKLIKIYSHNLRKWTFNRHQTTDDRPYGGGTGMIFKVEPIFRAVKDLKKKKFKKCRVILFSAKGGKLTQKKVKCLSNYKQLILICPRYEGVDERVAKYIADEEISIGDYILTGGELPAMILVDAITRLIPGAIKEESLKEESFSLAQNKNLRSAQNLFSCSARNKNIKNLKFKIKNLYYEYPQYTRPAVFYPKGVAWQVPKVLLSGNHKKINEWQQKHLKRIKD